MLPPPFRSYPLLEFALLKEARQLFFGSYKLTAIQKLQFKLDETDVIQTRFVWTNPEHFYKQLHNLTTLTFAGNFSDIVNLLSHTATLILLTISTQDNQDPLWRAMTHTDKPSIVPMLEELYIKPYWTKQYQYCTAISFQPAIFLAMVSSRTAACVPVGASPLKYIKFEANPYDLAKVQQSLQGFDTLQNDDFPMIVFKENKVRSHGDFWR